MRVFPWLLLTGAVWAQPIDLSKNRVDPVTFIFDDGRTTLADYVLSQIRQHTSCCGVDNIYVELRIDSAGSVVNVRAMTGGNDCYKQSVRDILLPVRWKAENFRRTRPLYYEFNFREECKGTDQDNVYKPVPAPTGLSAPVAQSSPPPAAPSPKETSSEPQPEGKPAPKPESPKPPLAEAQKPPAPDKASPPPSETPKNVPLTPSLPGTKPPQEGEAADYRPEEPASPPKPASARPAQPSRRPTAPAHEPARKGYQPGPEPPKEAQPPAPPAVLGKLPSDSVPVPLAVPQPQKYRSTGEKRPPQDHVSSYINTSGPRYAEPEYVGGPVAQALYLKKAYRTRGVCGLVHVLMEVAIDAQGNVRGYRILKANRPDAEAATPAVLAGMKYKPVPFPTVFYTEFKVDVDCQSDQPSTRLDSVPDYLATPEGKLIRPATPRP